MEEEIKKIRVKDSYIQAYCIPLQSKNFILLRGTKGYIMCGYLNMTAADKFGDIAVKISGVSSIEDALQAKAVEVSKAAQQQGIYPNQLIIDILEKIV